MPEISDQTADAVLDCPMQSNDAHAATVRGYLIALLRELWREAEGFSGKRPFGDSGWQYEVYAALGHAGLLKVTFDPDGYIEDVDERAGDTLVYAALDRLAAVGV